MRVPLEPLPTVLIRQVQGAKELAALHSSSGKEMPSKGSSRKTRAQGAATPNKDSVQESSHGSEGRFGNSPSDPGRSGSRDSVPYGEGPAVADGTATSGRDGRMQVGSPTVGAYAETVRAGGAGALPSRLADRAARMERGHPTSEIGQGDHGEQSSDKVDHPHDEQSPDKMDHSRGEESPDKVDHTQLVTSLCKDPQKKRERKSGTGRRRSVSAVKHYSPGRELY